MGIELYPYPKALCFDDVAHRPGFNWRLELDGVTAR